MIRFNWKLLAACVVLAVAAPVSFAAPAPKDDPNARKANAIQRAKSRNNLKQIVLAMHNFHDALEQLPWDITDANGKPLLSWRVLLLPYLDQEELFREFKLDEPWNSENNKKLLAKMPDVFRVGFEPKDEAKTYYQGFTGPGAAFELGKKFKLTGFTDGVANTLLVVEAGPPVEWTKPADIAYDRKKKLPKLDGPFSNTLIVATADGTTHALGRNIDEKNFRSLIEIADGKAVSVEDFRGEFPLTKEELELVQKHIENSEKLMNGMVAEVKEQQKFLLEMMKRPNSKDTDKQLEELSLMQLRLRSQLGILKERTGELKKQFEGAEKKPEK